MSDIYYCANCQSELTTKQVSIRRRTYRKYAICNKCGKQLRQLTLLEEENIRKERNNIK